MARINGKVTHIYSRDPALARTVQIEGAAVDNTAVVEAALEEFRLGKPSKLPVVDGKMAVVWHLRPLSELAYAELARVSAHEALKAFARRDASVLANRALYPELRDAARRGLVAVDNAVDGEGRPFKIDTEDTSNGAGKVVTSRCLNELYELFGPRLISELGERVLEMSEVDPT